MKTIEEVFSAPDWDVFYEGAKTFLPPTHRHLLHDARRSIILDSAVPQEKVYSINLPYPAQPRGQTLVGAQVRWSFSLDQGGGCWFLEHVWQYFSCATPELFD